MLEKKGINLLKMNKIESISSQTGNRGLKHLINLASDV